VIDTTSPHSSLVRVVSWGQVWLLVSRIGQAAAATSDLVDLLTAGLAEDAAHGDRPPERVGRSPR